MGRREEWKEKGESGRVEGEEEVRGVADDGWGDEGGDGGGGGSE